MTATLGWTAGTIFGIVVAALMLRPAPRMQVTPGTRCKHWVSLSSVREEAWRTGQIVNVAEEPLNAQCALPAGHHGEHLVNPGDIRAMRLHRPPF